MVDENEDEIVGFGREPKKKEPTKQQLEDQEFGPTERQSVGSKRRSFDDESSSSVLETASAVKEAGVKAGKAIKTKAKETAKRITKPIESKVDAWKERPWDITSPRAKKEIGKGVVSGFKALTGNIEKEKIPIGKDSRGNIIYKTRDVEGDFLGVKTKPFNWEKTVDSIKKKGIAETWKDSAWKKNVDASFNPSVEKERQYSPYERMFRSQYGFDERKEQPPKSTWQNVTQGLTKKAKQLSATREPRRIPTEGGMPKTPGGWSGPEEKYKPTLKEALDTQLDKQEYEKSKQAFEKPTPSGYESGYGSGYESLQSSNEFAPRPSAPVELPNVSSPSRYLYSGQEPKRLETLDSYEKSERGPGFEELRRRQLQEYQSNDEMERAYLAETGERYVDESKLAVLGGSYPNPDGSGTRILKRVPPYRPVTLKASFVFRPLIGKPKRYEPVFGKERPRGAVLMMSTERETGTMPAARMPRTEAGFRYMPFTPFSFKFVKPMGVQFMGMRNQQPEQQLPSTAERQVASLLPHNVPESDSLVKGNPFNYWQSGNQLTGQQSTSPLVKGNPMDYWQARQSPEQQIVQPGMNPLMKKNPLNYWQSKE